MFTQWWLYDVTLVQRPTANLELGQELCKRTLNLQDCIDALIEFLSAVIMPGNCILGHCKGKNASLHSFPVQNEVLNRKWIDFVKEKRHDFQRPTKHSKLCSDHFVEGDFANLLQFRLGIANRRLLKEDAVPSMHVLSSSEEAQWSRSQTDTACTQTDALKVDRNASRVVSKVVFDWRLGKTVKPEG